MPCCSGDALSTCPASPVRYNIHFPGTPPHARCPVLLLRQPGDVLAIADAALPEPGPGEVRIRTVLASIHNHDLLTVRGLYGYKPTLPAIGGSEALGVVDALGDGVDDLQIGQRVAAASVHGTWAEAFVAPARMVIPMPEAIPDEMAAQLIAMPLSALMLLEFLHVQAGQWIVQNTANGAVGKSLAMLAKARGVHVANLVRNAAVVAQLQALGIDHVFDTSVDGWKDRVREATGEAQAAAQWIPSAATPVAIWSTCSATTARWCRSV